MADGAVEPVDSGRRARQLKRARRIAFVLDDLFVDPALGFLVPGLGDAVAAGFGLYLVSLAVRWRLPRWVLIKMLVNLSIDHVLGLVPVVGDLFDVVWKANGRNLKLLETRYTDPPSSVSGWWLVAGFLVLVVCTAGVSVWIAYDLARRFMT